MSMENDQIINIYKKKKKNNNFNISKIQQMR